MDRKKKDDRNAGSLNPSYLSHPPYPTYPSFVTLRPPVLKRPVTWIALGLLSIALAAAAYRGFPLAFSLVSVDISMDRAHALSAARALAAREHLGPSDYREAASFELDDEVQTFVELEGGGKAAFTDMVRAGRYLAYTWHVRHFHEGVVNETTIVLAPDGRPYGFEEKIKEDDPGAALDPDAARAIAERGATQDWGVDLSAFRLAEHGQERRPSGRVDHTFTYEQPAPTLGEGRYRLRLVVSGDRLTEVTHFVKVPEAFLRRYDSMRSANTTLGLVSVVGMLVLYGAGGIGIGLFLMLRLRWVVWWPAAKWGMGIALAQALIAANEWPLAWMSYDTAVTRPLFITQQAIAGLATFVGFSVIYTLSFMAAETLTRRAFGSHPQLWRVWTREAGASVEILGRTAAGYLAVSAFFAYDVALYVFATHRLGWWSPSEALFHPDVLAAYFPWFSAIANSLQAGFWEECLFRAVPIAGAALIGDRLGSRRLAVIVAFVVQAIIFGSGHAPYPNQPFFARPVELIIPSIGFGLFYLYFGLVPGIILHFTFDTTWFAIPLFVAHAPGIWIQRVMVLAVVLTPLWVVLWRRVQVGRWTSLSPDDRNAAWKPESVAPKTEPEPARARDRAVTKTDERVWLAIAAAAVLVGAVAMAKHHASQGLTVGRDQAVAVARSALAARGVTPGPTWRFLPTPDDGSGGPQEFVSETAGEARRKALAGSFLPVPRWQVRVATFEGDVAERAEEWIVFVTTTGEARPVIHNLPEARPGATLDEASARRLAEQAIRDRLQLDPARGDVRAVQAKPTKQKARTDWTFTFVDATVPPLPQGEPRIRVEIAGDEVTEVGRFVFVPEAWQRDADSAATRNVILAVVTSVVPVGTMITLGVTAVIAWSRRRFAPRIFVAAMAQLAVVSAVMYANSWPTLVARLSTSQPYSLQIGALIGAGSVGLLLAALVPALVLGAVPVGVAEGGRLPDRLAVTLGAAAGVVGAGVLLAAAWLRTPPWASAPEVAPLGTIVPAVAVALAPVASVLGRLALIAGALAAIGRHTAGWSERRVTGFAALFLIGCAGAGSPTGSAVAGWAIAVVICGAAFALVGSLLLSLDLSMVAIAAGVLGAVEALLTAGAGAYPGASWHGVLAAIVALGVGWWWFRVLRRTADRVAASAAVALAA